MHSSDTRYLNDAPWFNWYQRELSVQMGALVTWSIVATRAILQNDLWGFARFSFYGRVPIYIDRLVQWSLVGVYSIHVPGWLLKWLNLITAHGSVSNEPGSVTWLATKYLKTVSWRNHTEELWPQNISLWPKINIPSSYFIILILNCLESTLKLQFDSMWQLSNYWPN